MKDETTPAKVEVMDVLSKWSQALWNRDLQALGQCYADDVRVFDLGAQLVGFDKLRAVWEACLPYFPNPIGVQRKDLQLSIGSDMAIATFYSRLTGMDSDHPSARSWLRTTVCLSKQDGGWKIIHDHVSLPVDCGAEKPTYILDTP